MHRTIYDAKNGTVLPSPQADAAVRIEGGSPTGDIVHMKHMIILVKHMNFIKLYTTVILSMTKGWKWFQVSITVENMIMHLGTVARWNMEMATVDLPTIH